MPKIFDTLRFPFQIVQLFRFCHYKYQSRKFLSKVMLESKVVLLRRIVHELVYILLLSSPFCQRTPERKRHQKYIYRDVLQYISYCISATVFLSLVGGFVPCLLSVFSNFNKSVEIVCQMYFHFSIL